MHVCLVVDAGVSFLYANTSSRHSTHICVCVEGEEIARHTHTYTRAHYLRATTSKPSTFDSKRKRRRRREKSIRTIVLYPPYDYAKKKQEMYDTAVVVHRKKTGKQADRKTDRQTTIEREERKSERCSQQQGRNACLSCNTAHKRTHTVDLTSKLATRWVSLFSTSVALFFSQCLLTRQYHKYRLFSSFFSRLSISQSSCRY
jgi:hypothetical protein